MLARLRNDPPLLALGGALLVVIALYSPTLGYGFVDYDDAYMIRDNWILHDVSWTALRTIFFDLDSPRRFVLSPEYLPVRDLSVLLDAAVWGDWLPGFHLTNLVLYVIAIVLWFDVLVRFDVPRPVAAAAMVLWALHPSHAESVAWLAERKGLLAMAFTGACGASYARFRAGKSTVWLVLACVTSICAVWSKAHAAFAVAALGGLELVRAPAGRERMRAFVGVAAFGVTAALAFVPVLMLAASSSVVGFTSHAPAGRAEMVLGVHGFYVELAAMLRANAVSYSLSTAGPTLREVVVGAVILLLALGVAFAIRKHRYQPPRTMRMAAVVWLLGWFPVSHLVLPLQMIMVADRYLLIPSLGWCLALATGACAIPSRRARHALIAALALAGAVRTLDAQSSWRSGSSLWARAVESNPNDGEAWSAYAEAVAEEGHVERATQIAEQGLTNVRHSRLLLRVAILRLQRGDSSGGLAMMREASAAGEPRAMSNLALLLLDTSPQEALPLAREGARRMPMYAPARRAAGRVELATGHATEAEVEFRRAYELEPTCVNAYNLSLALRALHRDDEARSLAEPCRGGR